MIVNSQPFTIITKRTILDDAATQDPPLIYQIKSLSKTNQAIPVIDVKVI